MRLYSVEPLCNSYRKDMEFLNSAIGKDDVLLCSIIINGKVILVLDIPTFGSVVICELVILLLNAQINIFSSFLLQKLMETRVIVK